MKNINMLLKGKLHIIYIETEIMKYIAIKSES